MTDQDNAQSKPMAQKSVEEPKVDSKPTVDVKPVVEEKVGSQPAVDVQPTQKPVAEGPGSGVTAPADDTAVPAGTDQQGRQLYKVKCASCGKETEVPFKPSGDRPVYCRDCYMQRKAA